MNDRRPWLILSAREARALQCAALESAVRSADLERALRQVDLQLRWIEGAADGAEPSQYAAVLRNGVSS